MEKLSDDVIADFKVVVADAEALLKATANQGGEKVAEVRARVEESLRIAKSRMEEAQAALVGKAKAVAKATDVYVHENPWKAIGTAAGVAAGVGLVLGLLIGRR
jgi:ElaB/YqjD/DUF883 family membrane-anchored ribosome-binding protein